MAKLFPDTASRGRWPERKVLQTVSETGQANEVKVETVTATGGTRTLTFEGQTTEALAYNASASAIQTALEALNNVEEGDIVVEGDAGVYTYTIGGQYAKAPASLSVNTGSLTGGSSAIVTTVVGGKLHPSTKAVLETHIKREATREALAERGLLRSRSTAQNELEKMNARKPKDIGDPERIPGEA